MAQEKNVTRNLILLLIGMIVIYLLQKNGNFFPILFVVLSIFYLGHIHSPFSAVRRLLGTVRAAHPLRVGRPNQPLHLQPYGMANAILRVIL